MSNSIVTNGAALAAVRTLAGIGKDLTMTQGRIESGLKINKASDDPAVFAIALGMRGDMSGLQAVRDSYGFAKAVVGVASAGAKQIGTELTTLRKTVTQGQQQGLDATQIQNQIDAALANITSYVTNADFNGVNLLNASANLLVTTNIAGATFSVTSEDASLTGLGISGLKYNSDAWTLTADQTLAPTVGQTLTITAANGEDYIFEFVDGATALTSTPDATHHVFDVQVDPATQSNLQMIGALVDRVQGQGFSATTDNSGVITINGVTTVATTVTGETAAQIVGGGAISALDTAITTMGTISANLGAATRRIDGQDAFATALMDSLKEGLGALVDADLAEESAMLQALQTRNQLAIQSLSIANQGPQGLLTLFR